MAILKGLDGNKDIKENWKNLPDDDAAINTQLEGHVDDSADRHKSSGIDNDSSVAGETQKDVNEELETQIETEVSDRIAGDDGLQSQINTIVAGGTVDPLTDVYRVTDLVNKNNYVITFGTGGPFDKARFNIEVAQTNDAEPTFNLNVDGPKPGLILSDGIATAAPVGSVYGITELQYSVVHDGYILINREVAKVSNPITSAEPISQVGDDVYKEMVVPGQNEMVMSGDSVVQSVDLGDAVTSVTSDASTTAIGILPNGTWQFGNNYNALEQTFNVSIGDKILMVTKLKSDSVGRVQKQILKHSDEGNDSGIAVVDSLLMYDIVTSTFNGLANFKIEEGTAGLVERDYQMLINLTALSKQSYTAEEAFARYASNGFLPSDKINNVNGNLSVNQSRNSTSGELELGLYNSTTGAKQSNDNFYRSVNKDSIIPSTEYQLNGNLGYSYDVNEWDSNGNYLRKIATAVTSFVSSSDAYMVTYGTTSSGQNDLTDKVQLEIGTETDYIKSNKTTISSPLEMKSLPNLTADKWNVNTGIVDRPIGKHVLVSGDVTQMTTSGTNVDYARMLITSLEGAKDFVNNVTGQILLDTIPEIEVTGFDDVLNIGKCFVVESAPDIFGVIYAKGTLSATAQADLSGRTIQYELETPITQQHESQQFLLVKGGTIEQDSKVIGELEYTVNLNQPAQVNTNSEAIVNLEAESDRKANVIYNTGTIPITGWVANVGDNALKLELEIDGILSTDWVDIAIDVDSHDVANIAQLNPTITEYVGGITLYANTAPTEAIPFKWKVVR